MEVVGGGGTSQHYAAPHAAYHVITAADLLGRWPTDLLGRWPTDGPSDRWRVDRPLARQQNSESDNEGPVDLETD